RGDRGDVPTPRDDPRSAARRRGLRVARDGPGSEEPRVLAQAARPRRRGLGRSDRSLAGRWSRCGGELLMKHTVFAIFPSLEVAEGAVLALEQAGLCNRAELSVIVHKDVDPERLS